MLSTLRDGNFESVYSQTLKAGPNPNFLFTSLDPGLHIRGSSLSTLTQIQGWSEDEGYYYSPNDHREASLVVSGESGMVSS